MHFQRFWRLFRPNSDWMSAPETEAKKKAAKREKYAGRRHGVEGVESESGTKADSEDPSSLSRGAGWPTGGGVGELNGYAGGGCGREVLNGYCDGGGGGMGAGLGNHDNVISVDVTTRKRGCDMDGEHSHL